MQYHYKDSLLREFLEKIDCSKQCTCDQTTPTVLQVPDRRVLYYSYEILVVLVLSFCYLTDQKEQLKYFVSTLHTLKTPLISVLQDPAADQSKRFLPKTYQRISSRRYLIMAQQYPKGFTVPVISGTTIGTRSANKQDLLDSEPADMSLVATDIVLKNSIAISARRKLKSHSDTNESNSYLSSSTSATWW